MLEGGWWLWGHPTTSSKLFLWPWKKFPPRNGEAREAKEQKPFVVSSVMLQQELPDVVCSPSLADAGAASSLRPRVNETEGFEPLLWLSHESWCKSLQISCLSSSKLLTFLRPLHVWPEIH